MADIELEKLNEVFFRIHAEYGILQEIRQFLTFKVPGYKFMPQFRAKLWDGTKSLVNKQNCAYLGLHSLIKKFAENNGYSIEIDPKISEKSPFSREKIEEFIKLVTPEGTNLVVRDYQAEAIVTSIQEQRQINLACTGSGKSAIIYYIVRWYVAMGKKVLIIVPTVNLVEQLHSDFKDYAKGTWNVDKHVQKIYSGFTKQVECSVVLSTWQSVFKLPKPWFNQFYTFIGDEAHLHQAGSVTGMIEKMTEVPVKIGTTGTLDEKNKKVHVLVLVGLFGPTREIAKAKDLQERGYLSELKIHVILCKYNEEILKKCKNLTYHEEMDFIVRNEKRNKFIVNLARKCTGTTLVLFQYVEKHGAVLYNMALERNKEKRKIYFIHGGVDADDRERIRQIVNSGEDALIYASYGTLSTGANYPGLVNIIFASPSKSKYRNLQSIGRVLRKSEGKSHATLYDIADNLSWKTKQNTTLLHAAERMKIYSEEGFEYKIHEVTI